MPFDTRVLVTTLVQMQPRLAEILILLVEESRQVTASISGANLLRGDYPAYIDQQTINALRT